LKLTNKQKNGTDIGMDEEIIASAAQMYHERITRSTWHLIFTNLRIIAVQTGEAADVISFAFGTIGRQIAKRDSKKESQKIKELTLEQILASEYTKRMYPYETIETLTVKPTKFITSKIVIKQRGKRAIKFGGERAEVLKVYEQKDRLNMCGAHIKNLK
jgi:hypothetical protein